MCLGIQIVTGVTLAMHYTPSVLEAFNSALHHHASREKLSKCILDLVEWTKSISDIDPKSFRRPYLAYEGALSAFTHEIIKDFGRNT